MADGTRQTRGARRGGVSVERILLECSSRSCRNAPLRNATPGTSTITWLGGRAFSVGQPRGEPGGADSPSIRLRRGRDSGKA
jgi:hypothetical protein